MTVTVIEEADRHRWRLEVVDEPGIVVEQAAMLTDQVRRGVRGIPTSNVLRAWLASARADAQRADGEPTDKMRKALHAMARDLLLDRDDRIALAEVVLERDISSWSELSYDDARRLLDTMNGYIAVRHLRRERRG